MLRSDKRVCLLTGSSGQLGLAFCRAYCHRYDIIAVYHDRLPAFPSQHMSYLDPLDLDRVLPANVNRVWAVQADLRDEDAAAHVVDIALSRYGDVDLLVNAAARSYRGSVLDASLPSGTSEEQFRVNVEAPQQMVRELCQRSWRNQVEENRLRNRNVVNVASTAGIFVYPGLEQREYAASKAALVHASRHLADELSVIGVRVNAVAPNAFPGIIKVEDVVQAIADLDDGEQNGGVVVVDAEGTYAVA